MSELQERIKALQANKTSENDVDAIEKASNVKTRKDAKKAPSIASKKQKAPRTVDSKPLEKIKNKSVTAPTPKRRPIDGLVLANAIMALPRDRSDPRYITGTGELQTIISRHGGQGTSEMTVVIKVIRDLGYDI